MCRCSDQLVASHVCRRSVAKMLTAFILAPISMQRADARFRTRGCSLRSAESGVRLKPTMLESSGDTSVDLFCNQHVDSLSRVFNLKPTFAFFDDSDSPNAYATDEVTRPDNPDGAVFMGRQLARELMKRDGGRSNLSLLAVLAHEYGHLFQFKAKYEVAWGMKFELTADYMAGWYLGVTQELTVENVKQTSKLFTELGDSNFTSPDHHGTPWQRSKIFSYGAGIQGNYFPGIRRPTGSAKEAFGLAVGMVR